MRLFFCTQDIYQVAILVITHLMFSYQDTLFSIPLREMHHKKKQQAIKQLKSFT